jgi:putative SOS response-associated peptidase YedK
MTVLVRHFDLSVRGDRQLPLFEPRYNIAPTQDVAVVRVDAQGERELAVVRWGLVPPWTKSPGSGPPLVNARAESVADKPAFRAAMRRRRCLVPADGFYEWQQAPGQSKRARKQPYFIHRADDGVFALAGLWETWTAPGLDKAGGGGPQPALESCTIVTTSANKALASLHDRMPVVVAPGDYGLWLDPDVDDPATIAHLLAAGGEEELIAEPVGTHVNRVANDDPQCIAVQRELFE